jgi:hypothetical protein
MWAASLNALGQSPVQGSEDKNAPIDAAEDTSGYQRPSGKERRDRYIKSIVGPKSLAMTVLGAGYSTARNDPKEWGGQWEGFGKRVASGLGKKAIKNSTMFGLDEALRYDSKFYPSRDRSFSSRIGNALISPLTARNERGRRVIGIPRIVGTYTSNIVAAETWYPSRYSYKDGLRSGTISLGMNAAYNLIKEFVRRK